MATEALGLPEIEVLNRVLGLPMIELAIAKSILTYLRIKDSHQLVNWVLSTAETSLTNATKQAIPIAAPFAKKFEAPIHFVDHTLCLGLDKIEENVPIVKETTDQIMANAYVLALQSVRPAVSTISYANDLIIAQAANLKDCSWNKINQILNTRYGSVAINSLDSTAIVVDKLLDKYFPSTVDEQDTAPALIEEDKLLRTLQTVGRLSNKAASRVCSHVIQNLRIINKNSLKTYVNSVVEVLQLAQYVMNENVQYMPYPPEDDEKSTNPSEGNDEKSTNLSEDKDEKSRNSFEGNDEKSTNPSEDNDEKSRNSSENNDEKSRNSSEGNDEKSTNLSESDCEISTSP